MDVFSTYLETFTAEEDTRGGGGGGEREYKLNS